MISTGNVDPRITEVRFEYSQYPFAAGLGFFLGEMSVTRGHRHLGFFF